MSSSKSSSQSQKLRDLIRSLRQCKTQAEERAIVQTEKALIREQFLKNEEATRARNIAKLLFIHMMGYDTDFGQMDCLKLITANNFIQKRVGYLGMTQLFNEKSEVLMMATNRMRLDLSSPSFYIISLSLAAISEISTPDMCRELSTEVAKIISNQNSPVYIRKKAILAASRIIRKVPEQAELFVPLIDQLMQDRSYAILLCSLTFIQELLVIQPDYFETFKKYVPTSIQLLKGLLTSYSQDYNFQGVTDPFLQVQILKFLRIMGERDNNLSGDMSEILAQVVTNTTTIKNAANAVLYENVKTIMAINSQTSLRQLAINILKKFIDNLDANSRYVSLQALQKMIQIDVNSVRKHKEIILECLKDSDKSIQKLSIDILYQIINQENVKSIVKELINKLLTADNDIIQGLTWKICISAEKYAPNRKWYIDTLSKVLSLAGNHLKDENISCLLHVISATPDIHHYAVHQIYLIFKENMNQSCLAKTTMWLVGEFGNSIIQKGISYHEIVSTIEQLSSENFTSDEVREIGLTSLMKIYIRCEDEGLRTNINKIFVTYSSSPSIEVQQRACEYLQLIKLQEWQNQKNALFEQIPLFNTSVNDLIQKPIGDDHEIEKNKPETQKQESLFDIDDLLSSNNQQNEQKPAKTSQIDMLNDIFGPSSVEQPKQQNSSSFQIMDLYNNNNSQSQNNNDLLNFQQTQSQQQQKQLQLEQKQQMFQKNNLFDFNEQPQDVSKNLTAFQDQNLQILFSYTQNGETTNLNSIFNNIGNADITNLVFQVAVLKYLKLTMTSISSNQIKVGSFNQVKQNMTIVNSMLGQKKIVMKLKVSYLINGNQVTQEETLNNFE